MPTQYHEFPYPDDDQPYPDAFETLADDLDEKSIVGDPYAARPDALGSNRLFIDIRAQQNLDAEAVLYASIDGDWVIPDLPIATDLSTVARYDEAETITAQWRLDEPFNADITGHAQTADDATNAYTASEAENVNGITGNEIEAGTDATVTEAWTFGPRATFEDGLSVSGRTLVAPTWGEDN
ncbi:MAG: hypothetical protein ACOCSN_05470 [Halanaeroarchaeum sp.]